MSFAEKTSVPVERSKAEIESMLMRYGAAQFVSGWSDNEARLRFRAKDRNVQFVLPLPRRDETRFTQHPRYSDRRRSDEDARKAWEQEVRRLWRALALVIKAKLEAVESGIVAFEDEFLAHIIMPDGKTVTEHARPLIASAYKTGKVVPLLSGW